MEEKSRHNFDSFWQSLLTVFQVPNHFTKKGNPSAILSRSQNYIPAFITKFNFEIDLIFYFCVFIILLHSSKNNGARLTSASPDINRRGLERCDVRRDPGLRRRRRYRRPRLCLFYYPLHMRQLYPLS